MTRTRALASLTVAAMVGLLLLISLPASAAGEVTKVGWWTDRTAAIALPEGSFEVARSGDGISVAAVEVTTTGQVFPTVLVLQELGGFSTVTAAIQLCVIDADFAPDAAGDLAAAPAQTCAAPTAMVRNTDLTWTADITAVLAPDSVTRFAIVPAPAEPTALPFDPGWVVDFLQASVTVDEPAPDDTTPTSQPTSAPTTSPPTTDGTGTTSTTRPAPVTVAPPPTAIVPRPVPPPTQPPPPDPDVTPTTIAPPVDESTAEDLQVPSLTVGPITGSSDDGRPWVRLVFLVPLSAGAGAGAVYGRRYLEGRAE